MKIFGDVKPGEITLVDVETVDEKEKFTFTGVVKSTMPDTPGDLEAHSAN